MRRLLRAVLTAAVALAASGAAAATSERRASASAGYRLTAGSDDYLRHALLGRGSLDLSPDWAAYSRLDLVRDRSYDSAVSVVAGLERGLPRGWLGWAGLGGSTARLDGGGSASAFLFETGAGRALGAWWADAEYRLTAGELGRVSGEETAAQPGWTPSRSSPAARDGGHDSWRSGQPSVTAPSASGETFEQHEVSLFLGSPFFDLGRPVAFGLSPAYWTRGGGRDGAAASGSVTVRVTPRWALLLGVSADFPSYASPAWYGSAGVRFRLLR